MEEFKQLDHLPENFGLLTSLTSLEMNELHRFINFLFMINIVTNFNPNILV
jgi:hypothetical protein